MRAGLVVAALSAALAGSAHAGGAVDFASRPTLVGRILLAGEGNVSAGCITMVISDVAKEIIGMIGGTSYESKFIPMMLEIKKFYGVLKVVE